MQTWIVFRLRKFPDINRAGRYECIGMCMRENGTICPFLLPTLCTIIYVRRNALLFNYRACGVYKVPQCVLKDMAGLGGVH